ncbi:hypothetical protein RMSM_06091 [Rhodopirellula maiorica SM1]|uniref:Uncharacterized protein n=1 Tax=Rhodopirellula maiorica SM1 TaxID=1265738 RepID=M5RC92_9BACT|nr:hypothetical protein RMSM_06091 [Rhodopirellula maiorica SM1]
MDDETNVSARFALTKVSFRYDGLHPGTRIAALTTEAETVKIE